MQTMFLTHHNLQGSQTIITAREVHSLFLTHHNLQGSQTGADDGRQERQFLTHHNLQGSQTNDECWELLGVSYPS